MNTRVPRKRALARYLGGKTALPTGLSAFFRLAEGVQGFPRHAGRQED